MSEQRRSDKQSNLLPSFFRVLSIAIGALILMLGIFIPVRQTTSVVASNAVSPLATTTPRLVLDFDWRRNSSGILTHRVQIPLCWKAVRLE